MAHQARPDRAIGVYGRAPEQLGYPEYLVAMIRRRADRERHRHDSTEQRCPESQQEHLIAWRYQQHRVAGLQPVGLQSPEYHQRRCMQCAELESARRIEIVMKTDAA